MQAPWTHSGKEVLDFYNVEVEAGLSQAQAAKHAEKYGKNGV
jgi:P-type Ca2+ transporter type 2A